MRAVLVGLHNDKKLYYDLDATADDQDGIVEMANGKTMTVDFFPYVTSVRGLKKLRTTAFHRKLWDKPQSGHDSSWNQMFVEKAKQPTDKLLANLDINTSLGKNRSRLRAKSDAVSSFMKTKQLSGIETKSCCGNGDRASGEPTGTVFPSSLLRRQEWMTQILLRNIKEDENGQ